MWHGSRVTSFGAAGHEVEEFLGVLVDFLEFAAVLVGQLVAELLQLHFIGVGQLVFPFLLRQPGQVGVTLGQGLGPVQDFLVLVTHHLQLGQFGDAVGVALGPGLVSVLALLLVALVVALVRGLVPLRFGLVVLVGLEG